ELNARSKDGNTPLHLAAYNGHLSAVEALMAAGADLTIENGDGLTAADVALKKDKGRIAKILQQAQRETQEKAERQALYAVPRAQESDDGATRESWLRLGADKVAHIGVYPALERKLTEIFSFSSR